MPGERDKAAGQVTALRQIATQGGANSPLGQVATAVADLIERMLPFVGQYDSGERKMPPVTNPAPAPPNAPARSTPDE